MQRFSHPARGLWSNPESGTLRQGKRNHSKPLLHFAKGLCSGKVLKWLMRVVKEALKQFSQAVIFQSKHLPRTCWPKRPAGVANIKKKKKKKKNLCSFFLKRLELYTYFLRKQTNKRRTASFPRVYALDFHLPLGWNLTWRLVDLWSSLVLILGMERNLFHIGWYWKIFSKKLKFDLGEVFVIESAQVGTLGSLLIRIALNFTSVNLVGVVYKRGGLPFL